jgi:hypothetical protein
MIAYGASKSKSKLFVLMRFTWLLPPCAHHHDVRGDVLKVVVRAKTTVSWR